MKPGKSKYEFIDYLFWFFFILFTNPGGIFAALGEDTSSTGTVDSFDFIFFLLLGCYISISYKSRIKTRTYKKLTFYLIIFGLYYLIIFGFFIPTFKETPGYSTFQFIKKSRKTIYSLLIFAMVYRFYLRSSVLFFKTLIISSIIVLSLFLITVLTGIKILPVSTASRGFVKVDRMFIAEEGLMILLILMGSILIVFKNNLKWKKLIILSYFMMFVNFVLSITRRDIIGTFIYLIIAMIIHNYIKNMALIPIKKMLTASIYLIIFGFFVSFSFPKYWEASTAGMLEAVSIVSTGETEAGKEDVRLGFGKDFMQNLILENPLVGTGFDNRWRGRGDKLGFETRDYPFLSAIAMTGVLGILIFLPIYILLFEALLIDIKFLRKNRIDVKSYEFFILIIFIIYFIFDLVQYMNWFLPVSLSRNYKWYTMLAMYFASRQIFYSNIRGKNQKTLSNQL